MSTSSRYHFLEGLIYYDDIETHINHNKVNLEIDINSHSEFDRKDIFKQNLRELLSVIRSLFWSFPIQPMDTLLLKS